MDKKYRYKDPELAERLVQRIKELRKKHPESQETAKDKSHSDIYRYEAGRKTPNLMSIRKICELFGISVREFFDVDLFDYPERK